MQILFRDESDSRVTSSSPFPASPVEDSNSFSGNWSHSWPTAVWQCFIQGKMRIQELLDFFSFLVPEVLSDHNYYGCPNTLWKWKININEFSLARVQNILHEKLIVLLYTTVPKYFKPLAVWLVTLQIQTSWDWWKSAPGYHRQKNLGTFNYLIISIQSPNCLFSVVNFFQHSRLIDFRHQTSVYVRP